ncbi:MAG: long-chain fatty acid--CoA ligase [Geminicoccaceae bacterium]|nr:long-chain fatty acid--CoA ligase [Geminicoccaceae bacterium]
MAARRSDEPFLWAKKEGTYRPWIWREVADAVSTLASAMAALGLQREDRVLLVSENRPEWLITDLAVMTAGGITVPAYTTNTSADHAYLVEHSGARLCVTSTAALARRLAPALRDREDMRALLVFEGTDEAATAPVRTLDWQAALALGRDHASVDWSDRLEADDTACFIYTSGTGGRPKGVMQTHANILANVRAAADLLRRIELGGDDVFLSFLPLSHAYEHTAGQFLPMATGAQIYYAEGIETLSTNLLEVRPTVLPCVPRLYEVLRQKILAGVRRQPAWRQKLFDMALDLGTRRYESGGTLPLHLAPIDRVLERLVRDKVRARFGGRLKAMVSGGAPLNRDVGLFFVALGLPVLQGYGQSEAAPVISVNIPGRARVDTVGPPLDGVELRIADDGEILVRGPNVMKGYWRDPEATAATIRDGWLHTGDVGRLEPEGDLVITDRKKDIIVNAGGDNISPQRVEGVLMLEPEIAQALVVGDKRPFLVALLVPDGEFVTRFAKDTGGRGDLAECARDPGFVARIGEAVKRANEHFSAIERIRRFHVMPEPFTVENGLLTPTMKLRRPLILKAHAELLESLYARRG